MNAASNTMQQLNVKNKVEEDSPTIGTLKIPNKIVSFNSQVDYQKASAKSQKKPRSSTNAGKVTRKSKKKRESSREITPQRSKSPILQTTGKIEEESYSSNLYYRRKMKQYKIERSTSRRRLSDNKRSVSASNLQEMTADGGHNNTHDKFSSKQSHRYSPFRSNDNMVVDH